MIASKKEGSLKLLFVAIVNIVDLHSSLVLCAPAETSLAIEAFGGKISGDKKSLLDLGERVSRKKEFIPALASSIQEGWIHDQIILEGDNDEKPGELKILQSDPFGQIQRAGSIRKILDISEHDYEM